MKPDVPASLLNRSSWSWQHCVSLCVAFMCLCGMALCESPANRASVEVHQHLQSFDERYDCRELVKALHYLDQSMVNPISDSDRTSNMTLLLAIIHSAEQALASEHFDARTGAVKALLDEAYDSAVTFVRWSYGHGQCTQIPDEVLRLGIETGVRENLFERLMERLSIQLAEASLKAEGNLTTTRCPLSLAIVNLSNFPLDYVRIQGQPHCKMDLRDVQGVPCSRTSNGDACFGPPSVGFGSLMSLSIIKERLLPRQDGQHTIDLGRYFQLKPGRYILDLSIRLAVKNPTGKDWGSDQCWQNVKVKDFEFSVLE